MGPVDALRFCREEVRHEYNVLGGRLTSYITSQSFLVTAYAVSMVNGNVPWTMPFHWVFPATVCLVGILASIRAQPGIVSAMKLIEAWHKRQDELHSDPDVRLLDPLDRDFMLKAHAQSLQFSATVTYLFGLAWLIFLALAVYCLWPRTA